jgi:hypothetical protein
MTRHIFIVSVLLAGLAGACATTTQSARYSRAPVTIGPVLCVGCPPLKAPIVSEPAFVDHSKIASWTITSPTGTSTSGFTVIPSKLNEKTASISDPCHNEFRMREFEVSAFGHFSLFVLYESTKTMIAGDFVPVPNGGCDMSIERWPLSGPDGIVWPHVMPTAAPPPPAAAVPPPAQPTL